MLDKLIDFILSLLDYIMPVYVVKEYQGAVVFRAGHFKFVKRAGLHWKWPFVDFVDVYGMATTTLTLPVQSVTTKDGMEVVVKGQVKYQVEDLEIYGVQVVDARDALSDTTCGIIFGIVHGMTWEEACSADLNAQISIPCRREGKKWGVKVHQVTLTDFSKMRSIRLFNEGANLG